MINEQLLNPQSIVVVGASNNLQKPGGKVLKNIIDGKYPGKLYVVNPKESEIQGIKSYSELNQLPNTDLAILAIPANLCVLAVEVLAKQKKTRAFIILSAGFSEESSEGAKLEKQIVEIINSVGGVLIGPNCIGFLNFNYNGVFTTPIPKLAPMGCDFASGSGATAVFIIEAGIPKGLTFSSVYSVGNSAQIGVEDVVKYWDESYNPATSSPVKLLYIESINKPQMLLKHAASLIRKGCHIAAIKSGISEAGSRAASSHTGALATPDAAVDALFRKAGIVRCYGREELATVASIFMHKKLQGKNIAIVTHAGGPAVMLTDALSNGGLNIPKIEGPAAKELLFKLYPGSSVANPIDFLATGTAEQLDTILDYCENRFDNIDAMAVIFGSPGLFEVYNVYDVLHKRMQTSKKPIYPILPSIINAKNEITDFLSKNRINFPDEVVFGNALCKIVNTPLPTHEFIETPTIDTQAIRNTIKSLSNGYITPAQIAVLLDAVAIPRISEAVVTSSNEAVSKAQEFGLPVVMKVVGPVHKSDVGGVSLNVATKEQVAFEFERMIKIKDTTAVLIQPMFSGMELFVGAKREDKFGHIVMCGLGGIFIETIKDVQSNLIPISNDEALQMIRRLKTYPIIKGIRGKEGIDEQCFAEIITKLSALLTVAPEISEIDINPLLAKRNLIKAVDARIKIEK